MKEDDIGFDSQCAELGDALFQMLEEGNFIAVEIPCVAVALEGIVHRLVFIEDIVLGKNTHSEFVEAGGLQGLERLLF